MLPCLFVERKERELNPQGSSLARFRVGCRRQSACPSSEFEVLKPRPIQHRRKESNLQTALEQSAALPFGHTGLVLCHRLSRDGRIRTGDLLLPRQAECPDFPTSRESAQQALNPHFRHGKAAGCRYTTTPAIGSQHLHGKRIRSCRTFPLLDQPSPWRPVPEWTQALSAMFAPRLEFLSDVHGVGGGSVGDLNARTVALDGGQGLQGSSDRSSIPEPRGPGAYLDVTAGDEDLDRSDTITKGRGDLALDLATVDEVGIGCRLDG